MKEPPRFLYFGWWNLHDFAHFDIDKISHKRWPKAQQDYEAKRDRILSALREAFGKSPPDLLAVCEITREAARDLAARMPGEFQVALPTISPREDGFHVAVFYRSGMQFTPQLPIVPSDEDDIRAGTRQMIPVHFEISGHLVRFVACHWTAFDNSSSQVARQRLADVLKRDCYQFLQPEVPMPGQSRHVVVKGDLNEEPTADVFRQRLIGYRDRESSRSTRWQDEGIQRVRLDNTAWRFLGEQVPHGEKSQRASAAGTLDNASKETDTKGWRTFDHLLVSGGLLGKRPPYLDETETKIVTTASMRDADGLPLPFTPGSQRGVSDHLLISARLVIRETSP